MSGVAREGWSTWQVVIVAIAGLLVGLLAGVMIGSALADDDKDVEEAFGDGSPGSAASPIAAGDAHDIGGGWTLRVDGVDADSGDQIVGLRDANEPPGPNESYLLVTVELHYESTAVLPPYGQPQQVLLSLLDERGTEYVPHQRSCGLIPNAIFFYPAVASGETIRANQCWAVPTDKVPGMLLVAATPSATSYFELS